MGFAHHEKCFCFLIYLSLSNSKHFPKTRVLTYRYAHLVSKYNIDIDSILAITFTRKAAEEMQERIVGLLSMDAQPIWVTTFHSACAKILRRHRRHSIQEVLFFFKIQLPLWPRSAKLNAF